VIDCWLCHSTRSVCSCYSLSSPDGARPGTAFLCSTQQRTARRGELRADPGAEELARAELHLEVGGARWPGRPGRFEAAGVRTQARWTDRAGDFAVTLPSEPEGGRQPPPAGSAAPGGRSSATACVGRGGPAVRLSARLRAGRWAQERGPGSCPPAVSRGQATAASACRASAEAPGADGGGGPREILDRGGRPPEGRDAAGPGLASRRARLRATSFPSQEHDLERGLDPPDAEPWRRSVCASGYDHRGALGQRPSGVARGRPRVSTPGASRALRATLNAARRADRIHDEAVRRRSGLGR
jgi:hypothetical protein